MIKQVLLLKPEDSPQTAGGRILPLELSILAGEDTFIFPTKLTQTAINDLFVIYQGLNLVGWKKFVQSFRDYKFEPVTIDIPSPDESEGKMFDLGLASGGSVKFLVRKAQIEPRILLGTH
jgi:hypothetical protein